ncbi:Na+/H+ antiporter [Deminuibacter soli]|uniref:Na+/H+ antiporter n=1 Tax=Deminuibacter soli TaxID=2291815 RepID=A0A3E1NQW4_9BACT|nr:Na+/H+ antiporter [Deminuibacter soli]RFM30322.1 Na+/H+ antiporter [Deminuibacter soli]
MLENTLLLIISLLFVVSMLAMLSEKLRISYPILLVLAGLGISLIPNIPHVSLSPDIVFIIFLPPLLYAAAWNTSWNDFWRYKRPIFMLAFVLVLFTATTIAFVAHAIIPDFSLALGFLLGGIVSPPDAIAATTVLQGLKIPKRITTILEGESLINDASSLIVFRFALATVFTGQFVLWQAEVNFFTVSLGGIAAGLLLGNVIYLVHRFLPTTPAIDTAITLISPYLMYIAAEHFHCSGVLAVVAGGLFSSFCSHRVFNYSTRLQSTSVWSTLVFLLNGIVFILIGLQLPDIIKSLEGYSITAVIGYAVIISLLTIVIRIIWVFPGAYLPRIFSKRVRAVEERPSWKSVFIVAWSGMRGVVSLASALSIPLTLNNGQSFPHRNLILFITFIVILVTLVLQGLSLSFLVKLMNVEEEAGDSESQQQKAIRLRMATAVMDFIESEYADDVAKIDAFNRVKGRYARMIEIANKNLLDDENKDNTPAFLPRYRTFLLEIVAIRRKELDSMRHEKRYSDELLRNTELELDLEEARLRR